MSLLAPLGAIALAGVPAILLLYFLKVRRPPLDVASLMLWRRHLTDRQANAPWQRLRPGLLLFLQLAAMAAVAVALARPAVTGAAGYGGTTVVLVDGSASMLATDAAPNRFAVALDDVRRLAATMAPGQQMAVVLLGSHAVLLTPPTGDSAQIGAALDRAAPGPGRAAFDEGLSLAGALLAGRRGSIVLVGDGHAQPGPTLSRAPAPLSFIPVGSTGENAAIVALSLAGPGQVFVEVANYGRADRDLRVEMRADGRLVDVLPMHVPGNSRADQTWAGLPAGTAVLEARLDPPDAFRLDDSAWLVTVPPSRRHALLVTDQNGFLERALKLRPGLDLTVQKPAAYRPGSYDLYVFDRFVPPGDLPTPALLVDPPQGLGPLPLGAAIDPGPVLPADPRDPVLAGVSLRDVHVQVAGRLPAYSGWRQVIAAAAGPLLLVHQGVPRMAEMTFDLHHSDLPLRAAFPILVQNLLDHLLPGGFESQVVSAGQPVSITAEAGARSIAVLTPDGRRDDLVDPGAAFTDTGTPGVYTVVQQTAAGERRSAFAVDFLDPAISRIAPGPAPPVQVTAPASGPAVLSVLEVWPWLAGLALFLLAGEWFVYHRGV